MSLKARLGGVLNSVLARGNLRLEYMPVGNERSDVEALERIAYKGVVRSLERTLAALKSCGIDVRTCVDVGAHSGGWTAAVLEQWPDVEALLVEPQAHLLMQAKDRFKGNNRLRYAAVGAGPESGEVMFRHHERTDSSTFAPTVKSRIRAVETLPVVRLDKLIPEHLGEVIPDILKLDCEGWDLEVLAGAGRFVGTVPVIFVEAGVTNPGFENTLVASVERLNSWGYQLFDVGDAVSVPPCGGFSGWWLA
jgi:FkbM family methyltransferase